MKKFKKNYLKLGLALLMILGIALGVVPDNAIANENEGGEGGYECFATVTCTFNGRPSGWVSCNGTVNCSEGLWSVTCDGQTTMC